MNYLVEVIFFIAAVIVTVAAVIKRDRDEAAENAKLAQRLRGRDSSAEEFQS